jgi:hypothetical protein
MPKKLKKSAKIAIGMGVIAGVAGVAAASTRHGSPKTKEQNPFTGLTYHFRGEKALHRWGKYGVPKTREQMLLINEWAQHDFPGYKGNGTRAQDIDFVSAYQYGIKPLNIPRRQSSI